MFGPDILYFWLSVFSVICQTLKTLASLRTSQRTCQTDNHGKSSVPLTVRDIYAGQSDNMAEWHFPRMIHMVRILHVWGYNERLRWSRCSVLAFDTQVRGFKPGRSRQIFKGEKILSTPSFGGEVKPSVPCRRFTACKRFLNGVEVVISAKLPDNILAHSSTFRR